MRRVVMVSAEVESFARTGGLGDAVEGLARALAALGADVVIVTPRYAITRPPRVASWWPETVPARVGWGPHEVRTAGVLEVPVETPGPGRVRACLLDDPLLFDRGGIYGDAHGEFGDNPLRFAALGRGALSVADRVWGPLHDGGGPDVIHVHDWHASFALLYARLTMGERWRSVPQVFTIHNLAFQGLLGANALDVYALPGAAFHPGLFEQDGHVNLMKGAIGLADRVVTVSASYAQEILTPEFGNGLDGFLRGHAGKLISIENGIDVAAFDPTRDAALAARFDADTATEGRLVNKAALLAEVGLDGGDAPLFAAVTRLSHQKGIDLTLDVVPGLVDRGARVLLVGTGDPALEVAVRSIAARYPGRVAARITFDAALARRVFGGTDFLLIPSRFEPCGLTQMYAMRYGALPVVTPVGGLRDTVTPSTGVVAAGRDAAALWEACARALELHADPARRAGMTRAAMARDSSWSRAAAAHLALYEELAPR